MPQIKMPLSEALRWIVRAIDNGKPEVAKKIIEEDLLPALIKQEQEDALNYAKGKI
jgi:hypothetical protein